MAVYLKGYLPESERSFLITPRNPQVMLYHVSQWGQALNQNTHGMKKERRGEGGSSVLQHSSPSTFQTFLIPARGGHPCSKHSFRGVSWAVVVVWDGSVREKLNLEKPDVRRVIQTPREGLSEITFHGKIWRLDPRSLRRKLGFH